MARSRRRCTERSITFWPAALIAALLVAKVFTLAVGGAASLLAGGTAWSRGIIRVLPPVVHGVADIAATVALIVAPFVFGFSDHTLALVVHVVVGAGGLGATLLTRFKSDLEAAPHASRAPSPV